MKLQRETTFGVWALISLVVMVSLSAIVVLQRMSPAIGQILDENVYSEEAVEEMLSIFAEPGADGYGAEMEPQTQRARAMRFADALERARSNVTEPEEPALVEEIHLKSVEALAGDPQARALVVQSLRRLGDVNRSSMRRSDALARRLGIGGAWACAILGVVGFSLGVLVLRRMRRRIEIPVEEIRQTLERLRSEDLQARCRPLVQAPAELAQIASATNWLVDTLQLAQATAVHARAQTLHDLAASDEASCDASSPRPTSTSTTSTPSSTSTAPGMWPSSSVRAALLSAMDLDTAPRFLVDAAGVELGRNAPALDLAAPTKAWPIVDEGFVALKIPGTQLSWLLGPSSSSSSSSLSSSSSDSAG